MFWVNLTDQDGITVHVNMTSALAVKQVEKDAVIIGTYIYFPDRVWFVHESPDFIFRKR